MFGFSLFLSLIKQLKKVVLKLELNDDRAKQKAMKAVSTLSGVDSIAIDMKGGKLTVIGNVDPVTVVKKLRKSGWRAELLTVGPAKEEKKDETKKDEAKKKNNNPNDQMADLMKAYNSYYNPNMTHHYRVMSAEEDPNACVIS